MQSPVKPADRLSVKDIEAFPVWEYVSPEDTIVQPVTQLPVSCLDGRLVGTRVRLRNGEEKWAILCNICLKSLRATKQFLAIKIEHQGTWFELARYFDADYVRRSPERLAAFLGLPLAEVFPIAYDISGVVTGDPRVLAGIIPVEPEERLSEEELVQLSLI